MRRSLGWCLEATEGSGEPAHAVVGGRDEALSAHALVLPQERPSAASSGGRGGERDRAGGREEEEQCGREERADELYS